MVEKGKWPKGLNKGPAVKVFAKHYTQKLLGNNVDEEKQCKCYVKVDDDYLELLRRVFEVLNFHDWVKYHVQRDLFHHLSSRRVLSAYISKCFSIGFTGGNRRYGTVIVTKSWQTILDSYGKRNVG